MHVAVALVCVVLVAEPQCPSDMSSCLVRYGVSNSLTSPEYACNTTNWMIYDYCDKLCPMRLIITDPPELRTWMCAIDNSFEPYAPDAHIDLDHPLNDQELELEAVGHPDVGSTRHGCDASDYDWGNKTVAGKIALVRRGGCSYATKGRWSHAAQAAMLFVVDYWPYYNWRHIGGSTAGIESFPLLFSARHEADYVLEALDRGVKVKGKFQYQCSDMPEGYLDAPQDYPWDSCGQNLFALRDTCLDERASEPLCEVCTVELQLPGAEKLCLFGNDLRPRKTENLMHTSWDMPYTSQQDGVVYATELADRGCSVSDYAGLAGKILLVPETGRCTLVKAVRSAQAAGVKAYILVTSTYYLQWYRVRAYSHHVHIPVHTVDYHATAKLLKFAANGGGRHIPGSGHALDAITFTRGVPPPTQSPTSAPLPPVVLDNSPKLDTSPDFKLSPEVVVCLIVVCVDVVVILLLFLHHRREAVHLPVEVRVKTFSIPLRVASMGLSVTLLLLTAVVTFSLVRIAGQELITKAIDNGRDALNLAYDSSEKSTISLSNVIRSNTIDRVLLLLQKELFNMESKLKMVQDLFYDFNGSWVEFDARFLTFLRMQRNTDASFQTVQLQLFTTRGFFMNIIYKTDDRPDEVRKDGVVGSVAETQEGWRYGVNYWVENFVTREFRYAETVHPYQYNASRMLAGNIGDPLAVTAGRPPGHSTWMAGRLTFPSRATSLPISAYQPLYGRGQYHGTIEVNSGLSDFINNVLHPSLQSHVSACDNACDDSVFMQNMSLLIVDGKDQAILGTHNIGAEFSDAGGSAEGSVTYGDFSVEGFAVFDKVKPFYGLSYMHSHPSIRVTSLANYLGGVEEWTEHEGEFDQKEYFGGQPYLTLVKVGVSNGRAADTGLHHWEVEMRDGACGACVVYDDQLRKEVLLFDGATTLHIYRNLTRRTPIVAQSQVSGPGEPWRSRYESFSETLTQADGTECVANIWRKTATESEKRCMLRLDVSSEGAYIVSMRIRPDVAYTETTPHATTPRLFSDSLVGDANIRLFANGQLYLFVLRYGCRTKAYDGGFPVHVWTTVTVVVGSGRCRVYVNGTLYDNAADSRFTRIASRLGGTRLHASPHRTGQFFRGRVDSVQLFRHQMSSVEVMSLHTQDRLVRDVKNKRYFAQTKTLDMNGNLRAGVAWVVAVMIPREDIMRGVDANRQSTLAAVKTQEHNTNKELTQRMSRTIMVIAAIAATSVVVFVVFNNLMTRPFEQTAAIMAQAAVMRLDSVPRGTSLITELGAMNTAIRLMLDNLKLYKSFMPQSVQLDSDSTSECDAFKRTASSGSSSSGTMSHESSFSDSHSPATRQLQCSLSRKRFTYVVFNVRAWHATINDAVDEATISLHASLLDIALHAFLKHKGVSDVFSGDRFTCSFNAAKVATQHKMLACACLLQCSAELSYLSLATSASAVSGEGRVGNMGNAAMRRFSFVTPVITWGHALERLCCTLDAGNMVDPVVQSDVAFSMTLRLIDSVLFPKLGDKPIRVHQLLGRKASRGAEEWMYELERDEKNDPMLEWNDSAARIIEGDFSGSEWMTQALSNPPKYAARLTQCLAAKMFEPFVMTLH